MNVTGRIHVSAQINPATTNRTARSTFSQGVDRRVLSSSGGLRKPARTRTLTIALYQDLSGVRVPGAWQRGGADDLKFRQCPLRIRVHAAKDEEVGGDAGVGWVVPVQRGHAKVKPHLLAQEADVGGHESDEERRPRDCAVNPGGADRPSSLALGERGRGTIRRGVPNLLSPRSRAVRVPIDGVDRQPLGNVMWIALARRTSTPGTRRLFRARAQRPRDSAVSSCSTAGSLGGASGSLLIAQTDSLRSRAGETQ